MESCEKATEVTAKKCPSNLWIYFPLSKSLILAVLSSDPVTKSLESNEKAKAKILLLWSCNFLIILPVFRSQIIAFLSSDPEIRYLESNEKAIELTAF